MPSARYEFATRDATVTRKITKSQCTESATYAENAIVDKVREGLVPQQAWVVGLANQVGVVEHLAASRHIKL